MPGEQLLTLDFYLLTQYDLCTQITFLPDVLANLKADLESVENSAKSRIKQVF